MTPKERNVANSISDRIREVIEALTDDQLREAKPAKVLPLLAKEKLGITDSVRSMTSKLLSAEKRRRFPGELSRDDGCAIIDADLDAVATFVGTCGSLERAKRVFARWEELMRVSRSY